MVSVKCDVLVLPQMRKTRTLTELIVEAKREFAVPVKKKVVSTACRSFTLKKMFL